METELNFRPQAENLIQRLLVKCPGCRQSFQVRKALLVTKYSKFNCKKCQESFFVEKPREHATELLALSAKSFRECAHCKKDNLLGSKECDHCGVIFAKVEEKNRDPEWYAAPLSLKEAWVKVLDDYENHENHRNFIRLSKSQNNLDFAINRYVKIKTASPTDEISKKYLDELIVVSTVSLPIEKKPAVRRRQSPFVNSLLVLAVILILTGFVVGELRNMVGIGTAFLFLVMTFKIYFVERT